MLLILLIVTIRVAGVLADPTAKILEFKNTNDGQGNYEFWYDQSDGIYRWQIGKLMRTSDGRPYIYTTGGYVYYDNKKKLPENGVHQDLPVIVNFVADENGYRVISYGSTPFGVPPRLLSCAVG